MTLSEFANHFVALLVIANPLSALPAVLRVTRNQSLAQQRHTAVLATVSVGVILLLVTWIGTPLLAILGIKLPAFQVAGGIVILFLAFSMLNASESPIKQTPEEQKERTVVGDTGAIVPLAIPIIAGPGAISTIIVSVNASPSVLNQVFLSVAALLVTLVMGLVLYFANSLEKMIGKQGINIFNRIGGLLLAAIAIQSLATGALGLFPAWGGPPPTP
jgi:multiple antibiotic resistance protein